MEEVSMHSKTGHTTYGYARVSTREQNLDRQMDALMEFGVEREDIFADKASGKDFERPAWVAMKEALREGDVLVVKSIDRFGRSTRRSSSSGATSPRCAGRPWWCWTCRFWTRGASGTGSPAC